LDHLAHGAPKAWNRPELRLRPPHTLTLQYGGCLPNTGTKARSFDLDLRFAASLLSVGYARDGDPEVSPWLSSILNAVSLTCLLVQSLHMARSGLEKRKVWKWGAKEVHDLALIVIKLPRWKERELVFSRIRLHIVDGVPSLLTERFHYLATMPPIAVPGVCVRSKYDLVPMKGRRCILS